LARAQGFIAEKTSTPLISEKMHGTGLGALTGFPCRVPVWELIEKIGRGEGIRTPGLLVPNQVLGPESDRFRGDWAEYADTCRDADLRLVSYHQVSTRRLRKLH
jgi:hypothetical protein